MMFKSLEKGHSLHKIAAELTQRKIFIKNGGKWVAKSITQIFKFNENFLTTNQLIGGSSEVSRINRSNIGYYPRRFWITTLDFFQLCKAQIHFIIESQSSKLS